MNFFKKFSIRNQLFILAILTVVLVALSMMVYYYQVASIIIQKDSDYTVDIFDQVKQSISSNSDVLSRLLSSVAYNPTIQDYMMEIDALERYNLSLNVEKIINKSMNMKDGVLDIAIVGSNGNIFNLNSTAEFLINNSIGFPERTKAYFTGMKRIRIRSGESINNCFIIGTAVFSINPNKKMGHYIGNVAITADVKAIAPKMDSLFKKSGVQFFLLDREENIFACNQTDKIGEKFDIIADIQGFKDNPGTVIIDGEKTMVRVDNLDYINGMLVGLMPESAILGDIVDIRKKVFLIFTAAIILLSIPFTIIISNILRPIARFKDFINKFKNGNLKSLKKRIHVEGYSEMTVMAREFNSMLDEIDILTNRLINANSQLYKAELLKKQSELSMLQSQINPHFLYNTLESIKGMALAIDADNIVDVIKAMARILKYAVKGADFVTLEEELDILKAYIRIQMVRFQGRFEVDYKIDFQALSCYIPRMILQPIVENAIHHGMEMMKSGGMIHILAHIDSDNHLVVSFRDNGTGIDKDMLNTIRKELQHEDSIELQNNSSMGKIGIYNVNSRIKLIYGREFGVSIYSKKGDGTEVILKFNAKGARHVPGNDCGR